MTITFDTPDLGFGLTSAGTGSRDLLDNCGGDIDWSAGLQGLSRHQSKSRPNSNGGLLAKVIEGEIIPRLLMAHRNLHGPAPGTKALPLMDSALFARLVLDSETDEIVEHVQVLLDHGIPLERVFVDLLAPVARRLGEFWLEDHCTFTEVTLGLSRLHQVLHEIGRRNRATLWPDRKRRAFFAPVPGEQHTFGVSMLDEFFLHAGWETACEHAPSTAGILQVAATQSLDIIGFSVGCQEFLDPLSDLIDKTRKASCNRDLTIMVGGGLFIDNRDLAGRFGNATVVSDGVHAVQVAEETVSRIRDRSEAGKLV